MPQRLPNKATERSVYPIEVVFYDGGAGGPPVDPTSAAWTLTDPGGAIINGREDVPLATSGGAALIVLQGADLAISGDGEVDVHVLITATYTSARYGSDLPFRDALIVTVQPLAGVPAGGP